MRITLLVITLAVFAGSSQVYADLVLPPPPIGLYRLAFVTSVGTDATSSDIEDYNEFVTDLAEDEPALAALSTTWSVIGSTADDSAVANTMTDPSPVGNTGFPIYRLDGMKIADHYDDLWDMSIEASISVTETGGTYSGSVWTRSTVNWFRGPVV
jgi:hypothetical protein